MLNAKFWAINLVAFLIIAVYTFSWLYMGLVQGVESNPFWTASPFQLVFIGAFFYLLTEGKLVQKIILAKRLKEEGTAKEFSIIDKSAHKMDDTILDRFKKN
jgi:hypothetical protein